VTSGPLDLLRDIVAVLDELGIRYALGGSLAAAMIGEPRSTVDVDVAVSIDATLGEHLVARLADRYYVPTAAAIDAIASHGSFNAVDTTTSLKLDVFVLGDGLLDRRQIERRVRMEIEGFPQGLWVTSPVDQVLRKLEWYRAGGERSDRQWRDVLAILRVQGAAIDAHDLRAVSDELGLGVLVEQALIEAEAGD
jgi:hypothetical protein